jgi:UDP-N-acetylglucosamine 2-epimerase
MSTFIGMVAAKLSGKRVVHVEAGLRSDNLREPFPEEIVRTIVDKFSDIKFAPSGKSAGRVGGVNVGNTSVDALYAALQLQDMPKIPLPEKFAVATIHRHENIKSRNRMEKIINILSYSPIPVIWFLHENARHKLREYSLLNELKQYKNIVLVDPMEYSKFVHVMANAHFVFTDGGGMSEECAELDVPCIILRMNTEREELLDRGDQVLTKLDEEEGKLAVMKFGLPRKNYYLPNPYDCGGASMNIVDFLERLQ